MRRALRIAGLMAGLAVGLIVLGLTGLWLARDQVARVVLDRAAAHVGLTADIGALALNRNALSIGTLKLEEAIRIEGLRLTFSPMDLVVGRLQALSAERVHVDIQVRPDGLFLGDRPIYRPQPGGLLGTGANGGDKPGRRERSAPALPTALPDRIDVARLEIALFDPDGRLASIGGQAALNGLQSGRPTGDAVLSFDVPETGPNKPGRVAASLSRASGPTGDLHMKIEGALPLSADRLRSLVPWLALPGQSRIAGVPIGQFDGKVGLDLSATASFEDGRLSRLRLDDTGFANLDLSLPDIQSAGMALIRPALTLDLSVLPGDFGLAQGIEPVSMTADARLAVAEIWSGGAPGRGLHLGALEMRLPAHIDLDAGTGSAVLRALDGQPAVLSGNALGGTGWSARLEIDPAVGPRFLRLDEGRLDLDPWQLEIAAQTAAGDRLDLWIASLTAGLNDGEPVRIRMQNSRLEAAIAQFGRGTLDLEEATARIGKSIILAASGGTFEIDDLVAGRLAEVQLAAAPDGTRAEIDAALRNVSTRAPLIPLAIDASVRYADTAPLGFDASIGDAKKRLDIRLSGEHDLASAVGSADVDFKPLIFAPDGLQPADLLAEFGDTLADVSGALDVIGRLAWGPGAVSDLSVLLREVGFRTDATEVTGLSGAVALDSLAPLSTPPGQEFFAERVDVGVPLHDAEIVFELIDPDVLAVESAQFRLADGLVSTGNLAFYLDTASTSFLVDVKDLSLEAFAALVQRENIAATGILNGTLRIETTAEDLFVRDGELIAEGPGTLRYRPETGASLPQQGAEIALQALQNFQFETLRIGIDGDLNGDLDLSLHIKGANPELYEGYPIEFNLNAEGALGALIRRRLTGARMPDRIRSRLQQFGD